MVNYYFSNFGLDSKASKLVTSKFLLWKIFLLTGNKQANKLNYTVSIIFSLFQRSKINVLDPSAFC